MVIYTYVYATYTNQKRTLTFDLLAAACWLRYSLECQLAKVVFVLNSLKRAWLFISLPYISGTE